MKKREPKKRELIFKLTRKDFVVEAKVGHGKGGQNRNRRKTACRISHPPSGAEGNAQDHREYKRNEKLAFRRLAESKKFKDWHSIETARRLGQLRKIDEDVEQMMQPKNILVEVKDNGRWVPEKSNDS